MLWSDSLFLDFSMSSLGHGFVQDFRNLDYCGMRYRVCLFSLWSIDVYKCLWGLNPNLRFFSLCPLKTGFCFRLQEFWFYFFSPLILLGSFEFPFHLCLECLVFLLRLAHLEERNCSLIEVSFLSHQLFLDEFCFSQRFFVHRSLIPFQVHLFYWEYSFRWLFCIVFGNYSRLD